MKNHFHLNLLKYIAKWIVLSSIVGILCGCASAFFLKSLEYVTNIREENSFLLYLLPFAGAFISFIYFKYGLNSSKGNNLIIEQANGENESIPFRMAPLVLFGTITTHLFGGSAGREGTAVQMGGALSEFVGKIFKLNNLDRKVIIICGIAGGFSSVFGTPIAGTIFSIEVLALGIINHNSIFPALISALVGNIVTTSFNVHHTHYSIGSVPNLTYLLLIKVIIASALFGIVALTFSNLTHYLKTKVFSKFKNALVKSFVGGCIIILLVLLINTRKYLGLSLPLIENAFNGDVSPFTFLNKLIFTSITLGAGYQGGEVTPLFVIGSTFGSYLATILNTPIPFLAALGFIGVFCGATNTPIACFAMGIELFGSSAAIYLFIVCIISYLFSGHTGIYTSQKIGSSKPNFTSINTEETLLSLKNRK